MTLDNTVIAYFQIRKSRPGFSPPEGNLPLIKKFIKPFTAYECEADLLQESYFGLLAAVKRYETDRNVQFMTFAQY